MGVFLAAFAFALLAPSLYLICWDGCALIFLPTGIEGSDEAMIGFIFGGWITFLVKFLGALVVIKVGKKFIQEDRRGVFYFECFMVYLIFLMIGYVLLIR